MSGNAGFNLRSFDPRSVYRSMESGRKEKGGKIASQAKQVNLLKAHVKAHPQDAPYIMAQLRAKADSLLFSGDSLGRFESKINALQVAIDAVRESSKAPTSQPVGIDKVAKDLLAKMNWLLTDSGTPSASDVDKCHAELMGALRSMRDSSLSTVDKANFMVKALKFESEMSARGLLICDNPDQVEGSNQKAILYLVRVFMANDAALARVVKQVAHLSVHEEGLAQETVRTLKGIAEHSPAEFKSISKQIGGLTADNFTQKAPAIMTALRVAVDCEASSPEVEKLSTAFMTKCGELKAAGMTLDADFFGFINLDLKSSMIMESGKAHLAYQARSMAAIFGVEFLAVDDGVLAKMVRQLGDQTSAVRGSQMTAKSPRHVTEGRQISTLALDVVKRGVSEEKQSVILQQYLNSTPDGMPVIDKDEQVLRVQVEQSSLQPWFEHFVDQAPMDWPGTVKYKTVADHNAVVIQTAKAQGLEVKMETKRFAQPTAAAWEYFNENKARIVAGSKCMAKSDLSEEDLDYISALSTFYSMCELKTAEFAVPVYASLSPSKGDPGILDTRIKGVGVQSTGDNVMASATHNEDGTCGLSLVVVGRKALSSKMQPCLTTAMPGGVATPTTIALQTSAELHEEAMSTPFLVGNSVLGASLESLQKVPGLLIYVKEIEGQRVWVIPPTPANDQHPQLNAIRKASGLDIGGKPSALPVTIAVSDVVYAGLKKEGDVSGFVLIPVMEDDHFPPELDTHKASLLCFQTWVRDIREEALGIGKVSIMGAANVMNPDDPGAPAFMCGVGVNLVPEAVLSAFAHGSDALSLKSMPLHEFVETTKAGGVAFSHHTFELAGILHLIEHNRVWFSRLDRPTQVALKEWVKFEGAEVEPKTGPMRENWNAFAAFVNTP